MVGIEQGRVFISLLELTFLLLLAAHCKPQNNEERKEINKEKHENRANDVENNVSGNYSSQGKQQLCLQPVGKLLNCSIINEIKTFKKENELYRVKNNSTPRGSVLPRQNVDFTFTNANNDKSYTTRKETCINKKQRDNGGEKLRNFYISKENKDKIDERENIFNNYKSIESEEILKNDEIFDPPGPMNEKNGTGNKEASSKFYQLIGNEKRQNNDKTRFFFAEETRNKENNDLSELGEQLQEDRMQSYEYSSTKEAKDKEKGIDKDESISNSYKTTENIGKHNIEEKSARRVENKSLPIPNVNENEEQSRTNNSFYYKISLDEGTHENIADILKSTENKEPFEKEKSNIVHTKEVQGILSMNEGIPLFYRKEKLCVKPGGQLGKCSLMQELQEMNKEDNINTQKQRKTFRSCIKPNAMCVVVLTHRGLMMTYPCCDRKRYSCDYKSYRCVPKPRRRHHRNRRLL